MLPVQQANMEYYGAIMHGDSPAHAHDLRVEIDKVSGEHAPSVEAADKLVEAIASEP